MAKTPWSDDFYKSREKDRVDTGRSAFHYSDTLHTSGVSTWKCHDSLNVKDKIRESRDSDTNPESNAIAVIFDVTGSMGQIPKKLKTQLQELLALLLRKGYIQDPQILFGAVGDSTCDKVPVQLGQFECGNEMENDIENIFIERGGGGGRRESYELIMYYFANKTKLDCLEKRGNKGYLFTIGDEMPYRKISKLAVNELFGDIIQEDLPIEEVVAKLNEQYHYFHILPEKASYGGNEKIRNEWVNLLDQNLLYLDDPNLVCELIGMTIGINEDNFDSIEESLKDLDFIGIYSDNEFESLSKSLSTVMSNKKSLKTVTNLPESSGGFSERL